MLIYVRWTHFFPFKSPEAAAEEGNISFIILNSHMKASYTNKGEFDYTGKETFFMQKKEFDYTTKEKKQAIISWDLDLQLPILLEHIEKRDGQASPQSLISLL